MRTANHQWASKNKKWVKAFEKQDAAFIAYFREKDAELGLPRWDPNDRNQPRYLTRALVATKSKRLTPKKQGVNSSSAAAPSPNKTPSPALCRSASCGSSSKSQASPLGQHPNAKANQLYNSFLSSLAIE